MRELISDKRIGIRIKKDGAWKILQSPSYYAVGGYWNKEHLATTVYFGSEKQYFYVLPMNVPRISNDLKKIFEEVVLKYETDKILTKEIIERHEIDKNKKDIASQIPPILKDSNS